MNKIITLVDFTNTANISVKQSIALAKSLNCSISVTHIAPAFDEEKDHEITEFMNVYEEQISHEGIKVDHIIGHGEFFHEVNEIVKRHQPILVVLGTHGKKGLRQNLFGANIYKLVKETYGPVLVINDNTRVHEGGFDKILVPVAPHHNYIEKVKHSVKLLSPNGRIDLFNVIKPGVEFDDDTSRNLQEAEAYLKEKNINHDYVEIESKHFSIGYSRDTLEYAATENYNLIAIMSKVSERHKSFGNMDKETLLLNENGLPILCVNP